MNPKQLQQALIAEFGDQLAETVLDFNEVTIEVHASQYLDVCQKLRDKDQFRFDELIDLCGIDYLTYGVDDWTTDSATESGFERAVHQEPQMVSTWKKPRFAAVLHLLSLAHNQRLRVRVFAEDEDYPLVPSIISVWNCADWYEREAFDLYGLLFEGHPDLRRILTDYGFVGHPFRKDFPLIGNLEMRYDANQRRCVYEKVSIEPRILVPKVIRSAKELPEIKAVEQVSGENNNG
ncbi:MAG: NADH-quinone oxidoreductase subunit C [Gammaproteobacteria bacterium CG22_combo_CG10-13_8_21_14_all_40_8]|nr:MAG: NADH-quinone oxidoreductase subunit C [Gammaproteobacteria bacterium CG22_combo_CG10-13_8_21_14_all_40_8]